MKSIRILAILALAVFVMSSCNPEKEPPTIKWDGDIFTSHNPADGGFDHQLVLELNVEAGIESFTIMEFIARGTDLNSQAVVVNDIDEILGATSYQYTFDIALDAEDFSNGVTKVIYEFTIIDKDLNEKTEEYTIFVGEVYTVTFVVTDGAGNEVEDAIITLGEVENEANDYVFAYVKPKTYSYKVEKAGYQTVEVEEVEIDRDMEIEVVLIKDLSDYSEKIMIAHSTTTHYAAYHGTSVTQSESTIIGVKYHSNTDNEIKIAVTSNCEGFVKVENDEFDTKQAVIDAYDNGAAVESLLLPRDYNAKAYAPVYFVAKVDGDYKLVKYVDGFVNPTSQENGNKGNVVVFQYKN